MKHKRKLLVAALLAVSVSSAVAAPEVLSEEELGDVSAQGVQVITNPTDISAQQNNNDSIQINGASQSGSSGMQISNSVNSADNINTNVINLDSSSGMTMSQLNDQSAENYEVSDQTVLNNITTGVASNVSGSAVNVGQNIANITNSTNISLSQTNNQYASNEGSDTQSITNGDTATLQDNNNGSVQLNDNAQRGSSSMVLDNTVSSAQNVGQNIIAVDGLSDFTLSQTNIQYAENLKDIDQTITNNGDVSLQNNNNGSVQVNDDAQTESTGMIIKNTANSAQNVGQNIISGTNMDGINSITQLNDQVASNGTMDGEISSQNIMNQDASLQNNNQASVQLNDNAQANTTSMVILNTANSASNTAQNITDVTGAVSVNIIESSNIQTASNYTRWDVEQNVDVRDSDLQRNNTNSVQLNDNAQNATTGMVIANTAGSASNIGQNIGNSSQLVGANVVIQSNEQYAYNGSGWSNWSFQSINNDDGDVTVTLLQDNNNASVQLNNGTTAQDNVQAMVLTNTAHSASNKAQNLAIVANLTVGNIVAQSNSQEAGQNNVQAMAMLNESNSASNTAQNVLEGSSIVGLNLGIQTNDQIADNSSESEQTIDNISLVVSFPVLQDNNNASVQADADAQNNFSGMVAANIQCCIFCSNNKQWLFGS